MRDHIEVLISLIERQQLVKHHETWRHVHPRICLVLDEEARLDPLGAANDGDEWPVEVPSSVGSLDFFHLFRQDFVVLAITHAISNVQNVLRPLQTGGSQQDYDFRDRLLLIIDINSINDN